MASGQRELNQIQDTCARLEQKLGALRTELKGEELHASQLLDELGQRQRLLASAASGSGSTSAGLRHTHAHPHAHALDESSVLRRSTQPQLGMRRPSTESAPLSYGEEALERFQLSRSGSRPAALRTTAGAGAGTRASSSSTLRPSSSSRRVTASRAVVGDDDGDALDGGSVVSEMLLQAEQQKQENEQLRLEIASLVQKVSDLQNEVQVYLRYWYRYCTYGVYIVRVQF